MQRGKTIKVRVLNFSTALQQHHYELVGMVGDCSVQCGGAVLVASVNVCIGLWRVRVRVRVRVRDRVRDRGAVQRHVPKKASRGGERERDWTHPDQHSAHTCLV
jgi:hypothetical protein